MENVDRAKNIVRQRGRFRIPHPEPTNVNSLLYYQSRIYLIILQIFIEITWHYSSGYQYRGEETRPLLLWKPVSFSQYVHLPPYEDPPHSVFSYNSTTHNQVLMWALSEMFPDICLLQNVFVQSWKATFRGAFEAGQLTILTSLY